MARLLHDKASPQQVMTVLQTAADLAVNCDDDVRNCANSYGMAFVSFLPDDVVERTGVWLHNGCPHTNEQAAELVVREMPGHLPHHFAVAYVTDLLSSTPDHLQLEIVALDLYGAYSVMACDVLAVRTDEGGTRAQLIDDRLTQLNTQPHFAAQLWHQVAPVLHKAHDKAGEKTIYSDLFTDLHAKQPAKLVRNSI